jgi:DivIVA domain-containing protein
VVDNAQVSNEAGSAPGEEPGRPVVPSDALAEPTFQRAGFGREGYRVDEVDAFVDQLGPALENDPPAMAPYEVADHRFAVVRWRKGYSLRGVDEYLAHAQEVLRTRHGDDPVASLSGRVDDRRHFPTGWIYIAALVLIIVIVGVAVTQL